MIQVGALVPETDPDSAESWAAVEVSDEALAVYNATYRSDPAPLVALLKSLAPEA